MFKPLLLLSLFVLIFIFQCSKPVQTQFFVFAHNFNSSVAESLFAAGVKETADSLNIETVILWQGENFEKKDTDSLFKNCSGIGFSAPVKNEIILDNLQRAHKKEKPLIQFNHQEQNEEQLRFVNSDSYTAGRAAAQHIIEQFGDNGRFGILTPTLDNTESTESIRGFREKLSTSKWKQVNIITCGTGLEQALKQYKYATRFGNRIIWFVANDCSDFMQELKNLKKDNFFIAIDLHPNENNIKFLQENLLDAVATKDFRNMGRLCVTELTSTKAEPEESENIVINCGSMVLTATMLDNLDH